MNEMGVGWDKGGEVGWMEWVVFCTPQVVAEV